MTKLTPRRHSSYEDWHEQILNQNCYRDHMTSDKHSTNIIHVLFSTMELFVIIFDQFYGRGYNPSGVMSNFVLTSRLYTWLARTRSIIDSASLLESVLKTYNGFSVAVVQSCNLCRSTFGFKHV